MLQINCIDRQVDDVLLFVRLTRSLRPRHCKAKKAVSEIAQEGQVKRGVTPSGWRVSDILGGPLRDENWTEDWEEWTGGVMLSVKFLPSEKEFPAVNVLGSAWKDTEDHRKIGHNCNAWVRYGIANRRSPSQMAGARHVGLLVQRSNRQKIHQNTLIYDNHTSLKVSLHKIGSILYLLIAQHIDHPPASNHSVVASYDMKSSVIVLGPIFEPVISSAMYFAQC